MRGKHCEVHVLQNRPGILPSVRYSIVHAKYDRTQCQFTESTKRRTLGLPGPKSPLHTMALCDAGAPRRHDIVRLHRARRSRAADGQIRGVLSLPVTGIVSSAWPMSERWARHTMHRPVLPVWQNRAQQDTADNPGDYRRLRARLVGRDG
jgi:hypothetical protein